MKLADIWRDYVPALLAGMVTNFEISIIALLLGLVVGCRSRRCASTAAGSASPSPPSSISLMRAAPTFVVMFFLLNVVRDVSVFGVQASRCPAS